VKDSSADSLLTAALEETTEGTATLTDEWGAYRNLDAEGRLHSTVNHGQREWARDDDGDGIREVHTNTIEGLWTSLRNWLRSFRGVSKHYLFGYVAAFEWIWKRKSLRNAQIFDVLLHQLKGGLTLLPG
jgi:transposase